MTKSIKKKITISIGIITLLIVVFLLSINLIEQKIRKSIISKANKNLTACVEVNSAKLSLLSHFPDITISLEDVTITGHDNFEGDTLLYLKSTDVSFSIKEVLKLNSDAFPELSTISCSDMNIYLKVLADGSCNWNILKQKDSIPFENKSILADLHIHQFFINHCSIVYNNEQLKTRAIFTNWSAAFMTEYSDSLAIINVTSSVEDISYNGGDFSYLSKVKGQSKAIINVDLANNKYTLGENTVELNDLKIQYNGSVAINEGDVFDFDIQLRTFDVNFKDVLSLIHPIYTNNFDKLQVHGEVILQADIKGILGNGKYPSFSSQFSIKNGFFKYPFLSKSVDSVDLDMSIYNESDILDSTKIDIKCFNVFLGDGLLKSKLRLVTPQSNPTLDMNLLVDFNLSDIRNVYPLDESTNIKGVVRGKLDVATNILSIVNEQFNKVKIQGAFDVDNLSFISNSYPQLEVNQLHLLFNPQSLVLSSLQARVGDSDFQLQGSFNNMLPYLLMGKQLIGRLTLKSDSLKIENFFKKMDKEPELSTSSGLSTFNRYFIPSNIDLELISRLSKVTYKNISMADMQATISVKNSGLYVNNMDFEALGGKINLELSYFPIPTERKQEVNVNLNLIDVAMGETLDILKKVKDGTIDRNVLGKYSLKLSLKTFLANTTSDILSELTATGIFECATMKIEKMKILENLSAALKMDGLKVLFINDIKASFTIKDNTINMPSFSALIYDRGQLTLKGTIGFDKSMDYTGTVSLDTSTQDKSLIPIVIKGTLTEPKLEVDAKSLISNLVK